jgi:L-lysine 2,3-aminomutase
MGQPLIAPIHSSIVRIVSGGAQKMLTEDEVTEIVKDLKSAINIKDLKIHAKGKVVFSYTNLCCLVRKIK